jgi:hypothetical protein
VRLAIQGTWSSINFANIFHAQLTTSSSIIQADLDSWVTSVQAAYKTRFQGLMSTSVSYVVAKAILYTPGGGALSSSIAMTGAGTVGTAIVENNATCANLSWLSTVYWRGGKPRTYLPGVVQANLANALTLSAGGITAYNTGGAGFRTDVNALAPGTITGSSLGFVSFNSGNVPRATPLFFPITGVRVHPRLGTQRRRLGKWAN